MEFGDLKIGYVPYLPDLSQPADRRRFPFFAKTNSLPFEIADVNKSYDVILLTAPANLTQWLHYKRKNPSTRFIFEMVDSLILPSDTFSDLFKGIGRYMMGKEKDLAFNFRHLLIRWIRLADMVICSSSEMKKIISQWNKNVIISLDYMQNEIITLKQDYHISGKMKLVWEGQSVVARHLLDFKDVFKQVNSFCEFHVITDEKYPSYGNLIKRDVNTILNELPIETVLHPWEIYKNYEMLVQCDCGIIPLNKKNKMAWHKPANKLISFWFAGLPALVSDTPAYLEFMETANSTMFCRNTDEWVAKIKVVRDRSPDQRKAEALKNLSFVRNHYSNQAISATWFEVFSRIMVSKG